MRRILLLSLITYSLFAIGLLIRNGQILALVVPFVLFLGAAFLFAPEQPRLRVSRKLSDECISPGKIVTVTVTVFNDGKPIEEIFVEDQLPPDLDVIEGRPKLLSSIGSQEAVILTYKVRGQRGSYSFEKVSIRVSDLLGLFSRKISLDALGRVYIKPEVLKLRSIPIRPLMTRMYTGPIPSRKGGAGMNFYEVRKYSIGDPLRRINWRATARHDEELFTNQFEVERITDVGLILDARQQTDVVLQDSSNGQESEALHTLFEYGIQAAAALADMFLREGHRVGLLIYGRGQVATFPGYGKTQREKILRSLAQARTGDNVALETLSYIPARFFPPKSQIVLISPLSPADPPVLTRLMAHAYQLLVVSPNPVSFDARSLPPGTNTEYAYRLARLERTLLLRRLQRIGVTLVDWQVDQPLEKVLGAVLTRAPREYRKLGIGL